MTRPNSPGLRNVLGSALLALFLATPLSAATVELRALLDLDDDATTGCTVVTVDGAVDGVDQLLTATVETTPSPGQVTGLVRQECDEGTGLFGAAIPVDSLQAPPWPVGPGNGVLGSDVVEVYFPLTAVGAELPIRIGLESDDLAGENDALLDLVLAESPGILEIPTLSTWGLLGLALLLAGFALWRLRRRGVVTLALLAVALAAGGVWAVCVLDGEVDDWGVLPALGTDVVGDAPVDIDLVALFARVDNGDLCLRYDVEINQAPAAVADNYATAEDTPLNVAAPGVLLNDSDPDSDPLSAVLDTAPPGAEVSVFTLNGDGSFDLTPASNFNGTTSFTYHADDGALGSNTVTVTVTVGPVPDGPMAVDDNFATDEDTALNIAAPGVLNNDSDPENDPLEVTAFDAVSAQGAAVSVAADGSFTYDPTGAANLQALAAGAMLDDTFTYTVEDVPSSGSDVGTVTVTVTGIDDPPTAVSDMATVTEDDPATGIDVLANDLNADGGTKEIIGVTQPTNGTVVNNTTDLTYEPDPDYCNDDGSPTDDFTYTVTGGSVATVSVTVTCVNDPPAVLGETFDVAAGNFDPAIGNTTLHFANAQVLTEAHVFEPGDVLDNDMDLETDPLSVSAVDGDAGAVGSPKVLPSGAVVTLEADGEFTYSPPLGFEGTDSFTYTVFDGTDSVMATVTIEIAGMVWYLDNLTDGTGDDGRSASPFDSIEQFAAQNGGGNADDPEAGDIIFIHEGAGVYDAGAAGAAGIDLLDQQKLWGEGIGLTVLGNNLVPAGNRPRVDNTNGGGLGVRVAATVADRTGIQIRGLAISGDQNAIFVGSSDMFAAEVTISDNLIDDAGGDGIDLNPGSSGNFTVTVSNNTWSTTSPAGDGLDLTTAAGNSADVFLALDGNTDITGGGAGVHVDGSAGAGTVYVTSLSGNTVNGATAVDGMRFDAVVFDTTPLDGDFTSDTVDGGATAIGSLADRVSGSGLVLDTVTGDLSFSDLDVANDGGTGLRVVSGATFNAGAETGFRLTTGAGSTINTTNGPAVDIDPATLSASFASIFNTNSSTVGISLTDAEGSFSAAGGSIATAGVASGPTFQVSGGSVTASFGGLVSSTVGNSVQVQNMTGGTVMVTGFVDDDGGGISVTGNDNATSVTFSGGLDLDTTVNTGFTATGDGTVTVAASANNNNVDTTTATAILVNGVDLTSAFDSVAVSNGSGVGISLQSSAGTKGLGLVSITNSGGAGLFASNAGAVNVTNNTSAIATTGHPAVDADSTTFGATFASLTSDDSATTGIDLASVGGSFTATTVAVDDTAGAGVQLTSNTATVALNGGTIGETTNSATTTGGNALDVNGGTGNVTVAAAITNTAARSVEVTGRMAGAVTVSGSISDTGTGINVANNSGGSTVFSNASKVVNTGANPAVTLANNGGHTVSFTGGGLDIDTTGGAGFSATGGGTVNVTGSGNTVNTTTGTGVNVANTTLGASDVTFQSVSVNGAVNGIVLTATGSSGGLVVTGDGSNANNASGGTIQNTSDHGVLATDTQDLSLTSIRIQDPGDAASEHGIFATSLRGSCLLRASTVTGFNQASGDGFRVVNNNVNLTELRVNGSTFSTSDGNDGLSVFAQGTSTMTVIVENQSLFTDLEGDALDIIAGDLAGSTATVNVTVDDNDFTNAGATGNGGIQARSANDGNLTGSITGNTFNDTHRLASTAGVIEIQGNNTGSVNLTVSGNDLDTFNQSGINVVADDASDVTVDIDGNFIDTNQNDRIGIRSSIRNTGATRLTIQNNQVGQTTALPGTAGTRSAIDIEVFDDTGATDDVRLLIDNNQLRVNKTSGTSEVVDIFVDANADAHVTVTNNTLTNVGSGDGAEIVTDGTNTTLCLDLRSNTATNPGPSTGDIELIELAGTYSVEALANVVANNPNANIIFDPNMAAFDNAASCLTP